MEFDLNKIKIQAFSPQYMINETEIKILTDLPKIGNIAINSIMLLHTYRQYRSTCHSLLSFSLYTRICVQSTIILPIN